MSHRLFSMLSAVLCMMATTTGSVTLGEEDSRMIKLENNLYILEIDRDNGTIKRIYDKVGKVEIISEPRLADSFRLLLPLGQRQQANYIFSKDQHLTTVEEKSNIPQWAKDGLKYGVKAILVSGWNLYGHDGGYPYYEPDPRLGTWDDLEAAIRKCHKMGVKVFFFVNIQPADINTDWFRDELYKYECNLKSGRCGFGMGTLSARKGWTVQTMAMLSPGFPEYRKIIVDHMKRLVEAGADGLHIDKFFPSGLDFNPNLKVDPDRADTECAMICVKEIADACHAINPDVTLSFETYWDRALEYSAGVTWHWGATYDNFQMIKFAFPEWINSLAMNQPYDYTIVNQCVRYGYHLMIGPKNWTASIGDELYQPIGEYIKEVLPIWEELKETIFFGEFLDNDGADFQGTTETRCSIHRNQNTSKRAAVVVNFAIEPREVSVNSFTGNGNGSVRIYQPYSKVKTAKLPLRLSVPGERFVVVVEE